MKKATWKFIAIAACLPLIAVAQDDEGTDEVIEEILVTGTHIEGLDLKGAAQAIRWLDATGKAC